MKTSIHPEILGLLEKENLLEEVEKNTALRNFILNLNGEWQRKEGELLQLRPVIDVIPNTISWIKKDLTYIGVNQALAQMCKLSPKDFVGKLVGFHSNDRIIYDFAFELFHGSNKSLVRRIESTINNFPKVFLLIGTLVHDEESIVIGVDVTELEGLKNHVQFNEKLVTLGELFAGIIHDMNNPLTLIEGHVYRLKKLYPEEKNMLDSLEKISSSVQKITKLTRSIRAFARNESGEASFEEEIFKLIEDAQMMIEHKIMDIEVILDPKLKDYRYVGNVSELFRVFLNLLSNSVDAVNELDTPKKWIKINIEESTEGAILFFSDAGNGIPETIAAKIFEPFYTTKSLGKGTGIGLSLSKKIMTSEGGDLEIDRNNPHTTFKVILPRHRLK